MVARLLGRVLDVAPDWIWKPANIRWVGSRILHFCYDGKGHRTIELDSNVLAIGRRVHHPSRDIRRR
jgi:hypothetical protein